ncbi:MAG: hypothetical protein ACXITV_02345 [Luteibaculaceae bacterium]
MINAYTRFILASFMLLIFNSCDDIVDRLTTVEIASVLNEEIRIDFTQGFGNDGVLTTNAIFDLNNVEEIQDKLDKISHVYIRSIKYRFKDFQGNPNALLSGSLGFTDGNIFVNLPALNPAIEAAHETIHSLELSNDEIAGIETLFFRDNQVRPVNVNFVVNGENLAWRVTLEVMFMLSVDASIRSSNE